MYSNDPCASLTPPSQLLALAASRPRGFSTSRLLALLVAPRPRGFSPSRLLALAALRPRGFLPSLLGYRTV